MTEYFNEHLVRFIIVGIVFSAYFGLIGTRIRQVWLRLALGAILYCTFAPLYLYIELGMSELRIKAHHTQCGHLSEKQPKLPSE